MSIRLMSIVWERGPNRTTDRMVLLALADYANDEGECWPSIAGIVTKTCMSERGVQTVIRRLQADGWLQITQGGGRKNCNLYTVKTPQMDAETPHQMHPLSGENPAPDAPRTRCTPQMDAETPQMTALNPAPDAPEPSRTIKEPSVRKNTGKTVLETLCSVHGVDTDAATSFIAYRKRHKSKALTKVAATRLSKHLWELFSSGHDPNDALAMAEERGWATVEPSWYLNAKGQQSDNRTNNNQRGSNRVGSGMAEAFANVAARLEAERAAGGRGR